MYYFHGGKNYGEVVGGKRGEKGERKRDSFRKYSLFDSDLLPNQEKMGQGEMKLPDSVP